MLVIDINTQFGNRLVPSPACTPGALVESLDQHHVAAAAAWSQQGLDYDCAGGNAEAEAAARASRGRLIPCAVVDLKDDPLWETELHRSRDAGVRLVRLFPAAHRWAVDSQQTRRLFRRMKEYGLIPMVSSVDSPTGWELIRPLARLTGEAGIPLVLLDVYYGNMAECLAVMGEFPHVLAETNWLATIGAVEYAARAVGAHHLLYGSGAPGRSMQKALNQVLEADLPDSDKALILGGNAMKLLALTPDAFAAAPRLPSSKPFTFSEPVIDIHSHLGHFRMPGSQGDYDTAPMLARMKAAGIERSVVSSYESMRYDVSAGNRRLAEAIHNQPALRGMAELDPLHVDLSLAELGRWYADPAFVACELELTHIPCPTASPNVRKLMEAAARAGRPVLFMAASPGDVEAECALARAFPDLPFIHAHGADPDWARQAAAVPNMYLEFCLSRGNPLHLRECLDILGSRRMLFGSDQILLSPLGQIGLYADALKTPEERRDVLSGNAKRLYRL